ncbi:lipocalin-like domain-containing protein [Phaeobacter gallaeciensis]|uniref:Secreted hydrolase n=1 Tax=Phaeobacter gallaeciensis TaxID=60890 RepID=A0AAC9Z873_9RHOB|nr:lipocalin-like domain-containing protein [Phaeobacter gallaeciensis]AHD09483.1 putative secreted hydrolase [Phaeobacter gallaeciensis DSM 26640]ATE92746.1 putative secreted hydrolase [Phaeobacter gallaeciensis]ATE97432.1 putative secreted hydrolase [Phaeobacter gallaeciensis]ATF01411.1 putative secreted hydrolase [Phaeobacter gallaeciensis]ATF05791.1 putative secreted hydrolase [Phaeobacter gallaeciensis]
MNDSHAVMKSIGRITAALILLVLPAKVVTAQGYAGLGTEAEGFAAPIAGRPLVFPRDHAAHPDYRIEWWYLTANLTGDDGRDYGVQWTLFRSGLRPEGRSMPDPASPWEDPQIWMGHAGLTTPDAHHSAERLARGGIGQAGVTAAPFEAYIDDWYMRSSDQNLRDLTLRATGESFRYDLSLSANGPLVLQGDAGYSVKSADGQASYYYSQPHYQVTGTLVLPDGPVAVTGDGWLDREWSSQPLSDDQDGWDWFSLRFDTGEKLMGFQLRGGDLYTSGTWIAVDGTPTPLEPGSLRATPVTFTEVAGRKVPTEWQLRLPARGLDVRVSAMNSQSWMEMSFPYWEGPVRLSGSHHGKGYLEMTGYSTSTD